MAFRKAAKARTKVANPARRRRKHRSAKAANPHRVKRRASRKRNGYMSAMAKRSHKRKNGYKRRNPDVGGYKLDGATILMVAGAGASTALVSSLVSQSGGLSKLGIPAQYQDTAAFATSAIIGAAGAYFFRNKPKAKRFFMIHAVVSTGAAVVTGVKAKTDEFAAKILPGGNTSGIYLPSSNGMGLIQTDLAGLYLPSPKGNTGLIQQDVGRAPARSFGK
jgi:succinyl-CoA synthetase beta subunit